MTKEEILNNCDRIIKDTQERPLGGLIQAREFIRITIGENSSFYKSLEQLQNSAYDDVKVKIVKQILSSFGEFVKNDLLRSISLEREIQINTVSDYLEQAESLLNDNKVHPAAPSVIIGASLEEFLRNWLEEEQVDLTTIKNSLDAYTTELKKLNKISKQDVKDLTSWSGIRNDAAHGHWDNVADRKRIKLMLEGVNLFMRKYGDNDFK